MGYHSIVFHHGKDFCGVCIVCCKVLIAISCSFLYSMVGCLFGGYILMGEYGGLSWGFVVDDDDSASRGV